MFHGSHDKTVVPSNAALLMEPARRAPQAIIREQQFVSGRRKVRHTEVLRPDGSIQAEEWLVEGAGHHWTGGDPAGSYSRPEGPSASREMMRFFLGRRLQA